jgi:hypothetical protein
MTEKLSIEQVLAKAFDRYCFEPTARDRADFVFHMTDWKSDLEQLHRIYEDPRTLNRQQAHDAVFGFLAHATWHLNAAYRLLMGSAVPDPSRKREQEKVSGTFSRYETTLRTNGRLQKRFLTPFLHPPQKGSTSN